jgi:hypothetical protein
MYGAPVWPTAIAEPSGEKLTPEQLPPGKVDGFANLVPKPDDDHW